MHIAMKHSKLAFTLIELLVVVTIIGILAGLAVPAFNKALDAAKKAQAGAMVSNLKVALNAYQSDYGAWPTFLATGGQDTVVKSYADAGSTALYKTLVGDLTNSDAQTANPRGTVYMEFTAKDVCDNNGAAVTGGMTNATGFKDPWGGQYFIEVDGDYDNQIKSLPDTTKKTGGTVDINASMAIWSTGTNKSTTGTGGDQTKYISSW
jgi:prepilin-type N-terminal cleavage/methylation domain-containing protein